MKRIAFGLILLPLVCTCLAGCRGTATQQGSPSFMEVPVLDITISASPAKDEPEMGVVETPSVETATESTNPTIPAGVILTLAVDLEGLSLADFFEVSNRALTLRSPETMVAMGLSDLYEVEEAHLDDISDPFELETYQMVALVLEMLEGYDREALSPQDQISYDVYHWYLKDILAGQEFRYHNYPATYYPITAVHEDTLRFFTDIHPLRDLQDARDYVSRLELVDEKIQQLINNLEKRQAVGITPPQFAIHWAVYGSLGQFIKTPAHRTSLHTALKEKLTPMSSGTPAEIESLLSDAERIIEAEVLPAYQDLATTLSRLETYQDGDSGVWRLPQGQEYYSYRLRHFTTTDLSAEEIHQLGLKELERIHAEMRQVFAQLGYSEDLTIVEAYDRVAKEGGHVPGDKVLERYETLIAAADQNLDTAFDIRPQTDVIVVPDPYGDYYVHPAFDGSRPGAFYAGVGSAGKEAYAMPTLAYHETIPGHHFQIALAQELQDLPSFRQGLSFTAFAEGWALYAERLAWELGWYQADPYGYLGFLQSQAFRAARLIVDTGLHADGWTFDQAQDFFTENTGFEMNDNVNPQHQIARYLVWPGQSTSYYVGYLKMMELRERAMSVQGEAFDLKAFHRIILTNGSMPLEVLETVIFQWLEG